MHGAMRRPEVTGCREQGGGFSLHRCAAPVPEPAWATGRPLWLTCAVACSWHAGRMGGSAPTPRVRAERRERMVVGFVGTRVVGPELRLAGLRVG